LVSTLCRKHHSIYIRQQSSITNDDDDFALVGLNVDTTTAPNLLDVIPPSQQSHNVQKRYDDNSTITILKQKEQSTNTFSSNHSSAATLNPSCGLQSAAQDSMMASTILSVSEAIQFQTKNVPSKSFRDGLTEDGDFILEGMNGIDPTAASQSLGNIWFTRRSKWCGHERQYILESLFPAGRKTTIYSLQNLTHKSQD